MEERKRPGLVWRKSDVGKEKKKDVTSAAEDKSRDGRSSVFDGLLRQFRRGSAKLKGKRGGEFLFHLSACCGINELLCSANRNVAWQVCLLDLNC